MEDESIQSKVIIGTIGTIKWVNDIAISPVIDAINPIGIVSSITPQRIRELVKVIGNLSLNAAGLINTKLGFKLWKSWLKSSESLSLAISSPECRKLCNESSVLLKLGLKSLNTPESKEFISQCAVVCSEFLDSLSNKHCKDLIKDISINTINSIELINSSEGSVMIRDFTNKLDNALKVEYDSIEYSYETEPDQRVIDNVELIPKTENNHIYCRQFIISLIFMFFALNGFLDLISKF